MNTLLNLAQVAQRLGVSRTTAWRLVTSGDLPSIKVTETIRRVDPDDLQDWIESRRERSEPRAVVPLRQREHP